MSRSVQKAYTTIVQPLWLTVIALAIAVAPPLIADEWQNRWNVSGLPKLDVFSKGVDVVVEPGVPGIIDAVLESDGASLGKPAAKIDHHQDGNAIRLDVRAGPFFGVRFLRLRIRAPRDLQLVVRSSSGSIRLHDLHGEIRLETSSAGGIEGEGLDGRLEAVSERGGIRLQGRFDGLTIRTRSGAIATDVLPGSSVRSNWEIQSDSGSVSIRVPSSLAAEVEANTRRGEIRSELPLVTTGFQGKDHLRGNLNGGGHMLLVWSERGSIRLTAI